MPRENRNSRSRGGLLSPLFWKSAWQIALQRVPILICLLVLQSGSSFILRHFEATLERHVQITLYLTMLVGAGGNAGNQAAVGVIRKLATGSKGKSVDLRRECAVALVVGALVTGFGFFRVLLFEWSLHVSFAISVALLLITTTSVVVGSLLPLLFKRLGLDPAHAGPTIQVLMDLLGVFLTCLCCSVLL